VRTGVRGPEAHRNPALRRIDRANLPGDSDYYPLDLIERDLIVAAVVELGRSRALMCGHLLCEFEQTAVEQINGDAGQPASETLNEKGWSDASRISVHVCTNRVVTPIKGRIVTEHTYRTAALSPAGTNCPSLKNCPCRRACRNRSRTARTLSHDLRLCPREHLNKAANEVTGVRFPRVRFAGQTGKEYVVKVRYVGKVRSPRSP
jgi:hypothetical protein